MPAPYTLTPAKIEASYVAGYPTTVTLSAKQTVPFVGISYITIVTDEPAIDPAITALPQADGTISLSLKTMANAKVGRYKGNLQVNVCTDPVCAAQLAGSPFVVPYDIEVVSPDGGVTPYNLSTLSPMTAATDWGTFQGNASHTGYVPVILSPATFSARWKWAPPAIDGVTLAPSEVVTGGGLFYVATGGKFDDKGAFVGGFSEHNATKVWSHSFADIPYPYSRVNPPAYDNGKVFVAGGAQQFTYMFGFEAAKGVLSFKTKMDSQWPDYLAPTIFGGSIFTNGGAYGGLYSFNPGTGTQNYFTRLPQYDEWTPAVDADHVYAYVEGALRVIDAASGQLLTTIADSTYEWNGYATAGAPVIGTNGMVFAGNLSNSSKNAIVAFDTRGKSTRWTATGAFSGNPAYANGYLIAANNKTAKLEARTEGDGNIIWSWSPPAGERFVGHVLATQNLVFVSTDVRTYAIDRTTHSTVWSYQASGTLSLSSLGILYIRGTKAIVAINLK